MKGGLTIRALTHKQAQALQALDGGMNIHQIARKLGVTRAAVYGRLRAADAKMGPPRGRMYCVDPARLDALGPSTIRGVL